MSFYLVSAVYNRHDDSAKRGRVLKGKKEIKKMKGNEDERMSKS